MYNTDNFYPAKEDFFKKIYVIEEEEKTVMLRSGHQFCRSKDCGVDMLTSGQRRVLGLEG